MRCALALVVALAAGCSTTARSGYRPVNAMPGELTLRYDDGLQVWRKATLLAEGPRYSGLVDAVGCVPRAGRRRRWRKPRACA